MAPQSMAAHATTLPAPAAAPAAASEPTAAPSTAPQRIASVHHLVEYRLGNGMRVVLGPDDSRPATSVNLVYRVGSRFEGPGEAGMAHLLEHMLFKGTASTPDPKVELSRRGMRWNATTSYDRTNYFAQFTSDEANLQWYLAWLADTMTGIHITADRLDSERSVVLSEMQANENRPERTLFQLSLASAFRFHPYGRAVIGTPSDLEKVSPDRLQAFYRNYYRPDNAVLVVTGKFDGEATLARIAQLFGSIEKPAAPLQQPYTLDAVQEGEREVVLRRVGGNPMLSAVYHAPAGATREAVALGALAESMSREPDGALYRTLVRSGLAVAAGGAMMSLADPGVLRFTAVFNDAARRNDVWDAMRKLVESGEGIDAQSLARTQQENANQMRELLESPDSLALHLTEAIAVGDWRLLFAHNQWLQQMGLDEIRDTARRHLLRDNRTLAWYLPTERPERAPAPRRADVPALLADMQFPQSARFEADWPMTPESIESHMVRGELDNGMKTAVIERRTLGDRVYLQLGLQWGDLGSLSGRWREADLLGAMWMAGTTTLDRQALEDRLRALDARMDIRVQAQSANVQLQVSAAHLDEAVALLADVLRNPAFPEREFEEQRRSALALLKSSVGQPESSIGDAITRLDRQWPPEDPRHQRDTAARAADLQRHDPARLKAFHRELIGASHAQAAVVGPVDAARVRRLLATALGDWRSPVPYERVTRPLHRLPAGEHFIPVDDRQNAVLFAGQRIEVGEDSADFPAMALAVRLLGGDSSARISARVREAEGLSYGASASLTVDRVLPTGALTIRAIHAPANTDRLREALAQVMREVRDGGFRQQELDDARTAMLQRRRSALVEENSVAALVAANLQWGDSMERWSTINRRVEALTLEEVNAAYRRQFDPSAMLVIDSGNYTKPPAPLAREWQQVWPAVSGETGKK